MKVRIGTFDDLEVEEIKKMFKEVGVKIDVRKNIEVYVDVYVHAEGRLSEVKEKLSNTKFESVVKEWERYIGLARDLLRNGSITLKEFEDKILNEAVPERNNVETIGSVLKKMIKDRGINLAELDWEEKGKLIEELMEEIKKREDAIELLERTALISKKEMSIILPLHEIMEMNGIVYDGDTMVGKLPNDPLVKIPIKAEPDEARELGLTVNFNLDIVELYDVYVDILEVYEKWEHLPKDERLSELFMLLMAFDGIIDILSERNKVKLNELTKMAKTVKIDENAKILMSDETIEALLKSLEKYGIVKFKRNFVKFYGPS